MPGADLKNTMLVDFTNNLPLAELFAGKKIGDKCRFTIEAQVKDITDKKGEFVIKKVIKDYDKEDEEVVEPTAEEPVAIAVMPMPEEKSAGYG